MTAAERLLFLSEKRAFASGAKEELEALPSTMLLVLRSWCTFAEEWQSALAEEAASCDAICY